MVAADAAPGTSAHAATATVVRRRGERMAALSPHRCTAASGDPRNGPGVRVPAPGPWSLDRVAAGAVLDRHPAQLGELVQRRVAAEAAPAGGLDAAEGHLRLVVDGGAVDVADAGLDLPGDGLRRRHVAAEHRGAEAVLGVVGDA